MDDFMVYPPCPCCTEREEYCSHHTLKLEILRLFAALLLDKSDDTRRSRSSSSPGSVLAKCSSNLVEALQLVLVEVRTVAQNVFEQLLSGSSGPQSVSILVSMPDPSYNVGCRILVHPQIFLAFLENFVRFSLRKTLTTPTFKFCRS